MAQNISKPYIQGGGFDCADNSTSGDGEWNNLVSQRQWIRQQMQAGGPTGLSKFAKFVKFVKFVMFFYSLSSLQNALNTWFPGDIELLGGPVELGGAVMEGNVFVDGKPVRPFFSS